MSGGSHIKHQYGYQFVSGKTTEHKEGQLLEKIFIQLGNGKQGSYAFCTDTDKEVELPFWPACCNSPMVVCDLNI